MENYFVKKESNLIQLSSYLKMKQKYLNKLINLHLSKNHELIDLRDYKDLDQAFSFINEDVTYDYLNNDSLILVSKHNSMLKANSEALRLIGEFEKFIKDNLNLYVISGHKDNSSLDYLSVILDFDNVVYKGLEITITSKDDIFTLKAEYKQDVLYAVLNIAQKYHMINSEIACYSIGAVILDNEKANVNNCSLNVLSQIKEKVIFTDDFKLKPRQKFDYVEKYFPNLIIEFNQKAVKENKAYLINLALENKNLISIDEIENNINIELKNINKLMYKKSLKQSMLFMNDENNSLSLCESCFNEITLTNELLKPFNQINKKKNCVCGQDSIGFFLKIK